MVFKPAGTTATTESTRPQLILLDGPTGAGKSMLLHHLRNSYARSVFAGTKLTTRSRRLGDTDWEFRFVKDIAASDSSVCYRSVGNSYAVNMTEARRMIAAGYSYAVTCTDLSVKESLTSTFKTITIYVYRSLSPEMLAEVSSSRGLAGGIESEMRFNENRLFLSDYRAQIHLYDHVILNVGSRQDATAQLNEILAIYGMYPDND